MKGYQLGPRRRRQLMPMATERESREPSDGRWETDSAANRSLTEADRIPCTVCGLRGHEAGDPDRCFQPISIGLGQEQP